MSDPLTIAVAASAASSLYGAYNQNKTNKQNLGAQQGRQQQLDSYIQPYLQQGQNPFAAQLMSMFGGGSQAPGRLGRLTGATGGPTFKAPTPYTADVIDPAAVGSQGFNAGQDSYLQMIRSGGSPFNTSDLFKSFAPLDERMMNEQVTQLRGAAGSLGQRFGTVGLQREANLRRDITQNIGARNAGIAQQSYEAAQGRVGNAAAALQQGGLGQMGILSQLFQANAGARNQASQFNAGQNQMWNQFMAQVIGQAGGLQQGQQGLNNQLLGIMAGVPVSQQQPNAIPGAIGDISQLLMFLPFLRGMGGQTPAAPSALPNNVGPYYIPGASRY